MRLTLVLLASVFVLGCDRDRDRDRDRRAPPAASGDASVPSAATTACNGETALVPGIPGSPGHLLPSDRNPNGVSELAALMRTMESDWRAARDRVQRTSDAPDALSRGLAARHARMRCAWPTQPADRDRAFDARAVDYLAAVRAFETAPSRDAFGAVLTRCRACHESVCTGALAAIDALALPAR